MHPAAHHPHRVRLPRLEEREHKTALVPLRVGGAPLASRIARVHHTLLSGHVQAALEQHDARLRALDSLRREDDLGRVGRRWAGGFAAALEVNVVRETWDVQQGVGGGS